jgi:hypothetical protein
MESKRREGPRSLPAEVVRVVILVVFIIAFLVLFFISVSLVGTSVMTLFTAVASLVLEAAAVWLALQALRTTKEARDSRRARHRPAESHGEGDLAGEAAGEVRTEDGRP